MRENTRGMTISAIFSSLFSLRNEVKIALFTNLFHFYPKSRLLAQLKTFQATSPLFRLNLIDTNILKIPSKSTLALPLTGSDLICTIDLPRIGACSPTTPVGLEGRSSLLPRQTQGRTLYNIEEIIEKFAQLTPQERAKREQLSTSQISFETEASLGNPVASALWRQNERRLRSLQLSEVMAKGKAYFE
ncbi:hypothetical protein DITRI_Ditri05aG0141000 [Diplodiscus trichospermus]